jgi:hypothetical protein
MPTFIPCTCNESDFVFAMANRVMKLSVCKGSEIFWIEQEKSPFEVIFHLYTLFDRFTIKNTAKESGT